MLMDLRQTRWLMYEQESTTISPPLLVILVFWLAGAVSELWIVCPCQWDGHHQFVSFGHFGIGGDSADPGVVLAIQRADPDIDCAAPGGPFAIRAVNDQLLLLTIPSHSRKSEHRAARERGVNIYEVVD